MTLMDDGRGSRFRPDSGARGFAGLLLGMSLLAGEASAVPVPKCSEGPADPPPAGAAQEPAGEPAIVRSKSFLELRLADRSQTTLRAVDLSDFDPEVSPGYKPDLSSLGLAGIVANRAVYNSTATVGLDDRRTADRHEGFEELGRFLEKEYLPDHPEMLAACGIADIRHLTPRQAVMLTGYILANTFSYSYSQADDASSLLSKQNDTIPLIDLMRAARREDHGSAGNGVCRNYGDAGSVIMCAFASFQDPERSLLNSTFALYGRGPILGMLIPHAWTWIVTVTPQGIELTAPDYTWGDKSHLVELGIADAGQEIFEVDRADYARERFSLFFRDLVERGYVDSVQCFTDLAALQGRGAAEALRQHEGPRLEPAQRDVPAALLAGELICTLLQADRDFAYTHAQEVQAPLERYLEDLGAYHDYTIEVAGVEQSRVATAQRALAAAHAVQLLPAPAQIGPREALTELYHHLAQQPGASQARDFVTHALFFELAAGIGDHDAARRHLAYANSAAHDIDDRNRLQSAFRRTVRLVPNAERSRYAITAPQLAEEVRDNSLRPSPPLLIRELQSAAGLDAVFSNSMLGGFMLEGGDLPDPAVEKLITAFREQWRALGSPRLPRVGLQLCRDRGELTCGPVVISISNEMSGDEIRARIEATVALQAVVREAQRGCFGVISCDLLHRGAELPDYGALSERLVAYFTDPDRQHLFAFRDVSVGINNGENHVSAASAYLDASLFLDPFDPSAVDRVLQADTATEVEDLRRTLALQREVGVLENYLIVKTVRFEPDERVLEAIEPIEDALMEIPKDGRDALTFQLVSYAEQLSDRQQELVKDGWPFRIVDSLHFSEGVSRIDVLERADGRQGREVRVRRDIPCAELFGLAALSSGLTVRRGTETLAFVSKDHDVVLARADGETMPDLCSDDIIMVPPAPAVVALPDTGIQVYYDAPPERITAELEGAIERLSRFNKAEEGFAGLGFRVRKYDFGFADITDQTISRLEAIVAGGRTEGIAVHLSSPLLEIKSDCVSVSYEAQKGFTFQLDNIVTADDLIVALTDITPLLHSMDALGRHFKVASSEPFSAFVRVRPAETAKQVQTLTAAADYILEDTKTLAPHEYTLTVTPNPPAGVEERWKDGDAAVYRDDVAKRIYLHLP